MREQCYVGDILTGASSLEEASILKNQITSLLASAGMTLDKWSANHKELLQDTQNSSKTHHSIEFSEVFSTLGIKWNAQRDCFLFSVSTPAQPTKVTKCAIASEMARLFQPLGWLAPVLIKVKLLLQDLWCHKLKWDTPMTGEIHESWQTLRSQVKGLESIQIPRHFQVTIQANWQIHAFADASKRAYAATLFIVQLGVSPALIIAKTKVAPTKTVSLPRLKLFGEVLLTRLLKAELPQLPGTPDDIYCWTDSRIVLAWLDSHPFRWETFVANRVSEVTSMSPKSSGIMYNLRTTRLTVQRGATLQTNYKNQGYGGTVQNG